MRRILLAMALVAAGLAAPGAARAQATPGPGQVTFDNAFIGAEACTSTATTANASRQIRLSWQDQPVAGATGAAGVFRIYATNQNPSANSASTGGALFCATTNNTSNPSGPVFAGQVGTDLPNSGTQLTDVATENAAEIGQKAGGCSIANGAAIYVCVHFFPYTTGTTTPQPNATAWAVGTMTLSLAAPTATTLKSVLPGNGALSASWSSSGAAKYKVFAVSLHDPTSVPTSGVFNSPSTFGGFDPADPTPHSSGFVTGTGPYRLGGLVNGLTYGVSVIAYTDAETPSDPSNVLTGSPQVVNDFWDLYKAEGGRETGGCSSGIAGPVGLLVAAATLALVRRRT